jgi:hypothetical protein
VQEDGGGRGDAEGVDLGGDRDRHLDVGPVAQLGGQAEALVADQQDEALGASEAAEGAGAG